MLNMVIFGAPGSGKGTQSEKIVEKYALLHVSTGDILRQEIKAGSALGNLAESYMSKGQLVPDKLVIDVLEKLIERHRDAKGFIFDGFPRTLAQGEALDQMLAQHGAEVDAVISLEVDQEELLDRLLKRGLISGRSDDNRETIMSRLKVYEEQTSPLKDYYRKQEKLRAIKGVGSIDDIFQSIATEIDRVL